MWQTFVIKRTREERERKEGGSPEERALRGGESEESARGTLKPGSETNRQGGRQLLLSRYLY